MIDREIKFEMVQVTALQDKKRALLSNPKYIIFHEPKLYLKIKLSSKTKNIEKEHCPQNREQASHIFHQTK